MSAHCRAAGAPPPPLPGGSHMQTRSDCLSQLKQFNLHYKPCQPSIQDCQSLSGKGVRKGQKLGRL